MGKNLQIRIILLLFVNILIGVELNVWRAFLHVDNSLSKYLIIIGLIIADVLAGIAIFRVYLKKGE
ncbi:MAG: hypothetical protein HY529_00205 [Chloroflexi bacterium]|nr:hypothetical protein [Chloroflexota bacterium]